MKTIFITFFSCHKKLKVPKVANLYVACLRADTHRQVIRKQIFYFFTLGILVHFRHFKLGYGFATLSGALPHYIIGGRING